MDSIETTLRNTSDMNSKTLNGISATLRHLQDSMGQRCAHRETEDSKNAPGQAPHANTANNPGAATNKDLLRRLKRGYLVQFEHDESGEHTSDPARKMQLLDIFKREVHSMKLLMMSSTPVDEAFSKEETV